MAVPNQGARIKQQGMTAAAAMTSKWKRSLGQLKEKIHNWGASQRANRVRLTNGKTKVLC